MKFTSYAQTDTGQVRQLNEDNMRIVIPTKPKDMSRRGELFVVADGMGGHDAGEVASSQAIETIAEVYYRTSGEPDHALKAAIEKANAVIFERAQKEDHYGMGTTVVAASRIDNRLYIAHVGDSRLYLIRNREIYPLTDDHSLVAEQIKAGILTPEEALSHPLRNVISRAVGTTPNVEVEISTHSPLILEEGDVVLLCSDGLTEHVREHEIIKIVSNRSPKQAAKALIKAANQGGGRDNITVIMVRVGDISEENEHVSSTASFDAVSAPTKKLPAITGSQQALAVGEKSGASGRGRGSIFWLRTFLLFVIVLGIGGAALNYLGPNLAPNLSSLISAISPSSPTPSPTTTISLPTVPTPLATFTSGVVLQPIDPTVVAAPTTVPVTPSATFTLTPTLIPTFTPTLRPTLTPTFTTTPTASSTLTPSVTATSEPAATSTPEESQSQSNGNQEAQLTVSDPITSTATLTPTLTIDPSSNQASRPSNSTPEPSTTIGISETVTLTATIEIVASPTVTVTAAATEENLP